MISEQLQGGTSPFITQTKRFCCIMLGIAHVLVITFHCQDLDTPWIFCWGRMEPITDHMRNVSLNHRAAEAAMSASKTEDRAPATAGEGSDRPLTGASAAGAAKSGVVRGASSAKDRVSEGFDVCFLSDFARCRRP